MRSQLFPFWGLSPTKLYPLERYLPLLPITLAIWGLLLYPSRLYRSQRTVLLQEAARDVLRISIVSALLLILIIYGLRLDDRLLGDDKISRTWIFLQCLLAILFLLARIVAVRFLARVWGKVEVGALDDLPVLTYDCTPASEIQWVGKRVMDVSISALLLTVAMPVMLLIAGLLKLAGGGRVLFTQTRCGLNGRRFTLYKFRTMVEDAESQRQAIDHLNQMSGPVFKVKRDPRVTPVGRWLRRLSLDELPQLWNVLRGDMSLVGPRPPVPQEVSQYQRWQRRRLSMRPFSACIDASPASPTRTASSPAV